MSSSSNSKTKADEISLKDVLLKTQFWGRYLIQKWKWISLFTVIGLAGGLTHAFLSKPDYTANMSFVTDTDKGGNGGLGLYLGLAAQFGLNTGSLGMNNGLFSGKNIFDLMKTRLILQRTLLTSVSIDSENTILINRYIELENLRKKKKLFRDVSFNKGDTSLSTEQSKVMKAVCKLIVNQMDFNTGSIMEVSFTSKGEQFSQAFLNTLMQNVEEFYIATITKRARDNLAILQKQLDSVRQQLYGAMGNVASFQDVNQNLVRQKPRVQQQKSSMKVSINSAIYQQLVTGLETARMTLQRETPLFEVIDQPILPLDKARPGKVKWGIAGALLGLMLSAGWFLLKRIYQEIMSSE